MTSIEKFINSNFVVSVATTSNNKPRVSALEYVVVNDKIIIATSPDSIKAKNLEINNFISASIVAMPQFVTLDGIVAPANKEQIEEYNRVLFQRHPEFVELVEKGLMKPFIYFMINDITAYYNDYSQGMSPTQVFKY